MLLKVLRKLAGVDRSAGEERVPDEGLLEYATDLMVNGDKRGAVRAYRDYLLTDPSNTRALNDLGACLADIGDLEQAAASFELAYSLDDTFIPAMVNHAKLLVDNNRGEEALVFLQRARICAPEFKHTENVYAGLLMRQGDIDRARKFQLKSWLSDFDNLRSANANLFWVGYDDVDEQTIAGEHRFWAETLKPIGGDDWQPPTAGYAGRKIRIGYWSPDFRNHAVRYFFRPLLEHHDRERFEVILYHDFPGRDAQTESIERSADEFHEVHDLMDLDLRDLIRSHGLDILVDLAGHTSHNRMSLLQCRMASLQINALGYPPTTGLPSIDYKLMDRHILTPDAPRFYAERPLVLPDSIWCFDPMEDVPIAPEPPVVANGYVTFGAVGNVSKISQRIAKAWVEILAAVPSSRLVVRSVTFVDPTGLAATRGRLAQWGLPMERLDFRAPEGGAAFFSSYDEIDIILDTFPFNGGTTSCFATYMGVPLVAVSGQSLISRVALSILATLGFPDLAVPDVESYVACAVALANDPERVRLFKHTARERYRTTSLGNGALFAKDFEEACLQALADVDRPGSVRQNRLAVLPEREIIRRAYAVLGANQPEATQRVLRHCLDHYPNAGPAHLLWAQILVWGGLVDDAIAYLSAQMGTLSGADQVSSLISIARMRLLQRDTRGARDSMSLLGELAVEDAFDQAQVRLYGACAQVVDGKAEVSPSTDGSPATALHVLVPCDSNDLFEAIRAQVEAACVVPPGCTLSFARCDEAQRIGAYRRVLTRHPGAVVVLLQKNVEIHQPLFISHILSALETADCVGSSGARRWRRIDWRADDFDQKAGGFISTSSEKPGAHELHLVGLGTEPVVDGMAILDGAVLAVRAGADLADGFDDNVLGCETLLEESWTHALWRAGKRLAVHRNLGVFLAGVELDASNRSEARLECARQMAFEPFESLKDDHVSLSTPAGSTAEAVRIADAYFIGDR